LPELIHSEPDEAIQRRMTRLMIDVRILGEQLTRAQTKTLYGEIEAARDGLSRILDRVDGKHAPTRY